MAKKKKRPTPAGRGGRPGDGGHRGAEGGGSYVTLVAVSLLVVLAAAVGGFFLGTSRQLQDFQLAQRVLATHQTVPHDKRGKQFTPGVTLGYVTPWNKKGREYSLEFKAKLDLVAPVWFQLKRESVGVVTVQGKQDIDTEWVQQMRRQGPNGHRTKVVPRFIVDNWTQEEWTSLLANPVEQMAVGNAMAEVCVQHGFDGVVLEMWSLVHVTDATRGYMRQAVLHISRALRQQHLVFVLVLPSSRVTFNAEDFATMAAHVDFFSVNTYDYSQGLGPGPNAPIAWITESLEQLQPKPGQAGKVLLGLNFYGNRYASQAAAGQPGVHTVLSHDLVEVLSDHLHALEYRWDAATKEHAIRIQATDESVYYPSLESVEARLALARERGYGVCVWELGQGLRHFFQLL